MRHRERTVLEQAIQVVAEQATKADALVDEAIDVGHGRSDPLVTHAKMLRLELLNVKADLERELDRRLEGHGGRLTNIEGRHHSDVPADDVAS
jgi:hypothetical protein